MTFSHSTVKLLALMGVLAAVPAAAQPPTYHITDLNAVAGAELCVATAINDAGMTAGSCGQDISTNQGAAEWRNGGFAKLGLLPSGHFAGATAINSLGVVVGDADAGDWQPRPFVATKNGLLNIDQQGGANMRTIGIMDSGVIFANYAKGSSGNTSAWTPVYYVEEARKPGRYRRFEMPRVPGGDSNVNGAYATASNKAGQVAGAVQNSLFGQKGAFWNNDSKHSVVVLEPLEGATQSFAWGINDVGQAVGTSYFPFVGDRAVMWNNDLSHTAINLGMLPGDVESSAMAANTSGQIVGVSRGTTGEPRGFLYQQGEMFDLATLVAAEDGAWTISQVFAINNNGQIVAIGRIDGRWASVLLTPTAR